MIETLSILSILYIWLFILSIKLRDNSIADVFWGFGFTIIASTTLCLLTSPNIVQLVLSSLVIFWWARLTLHIHNKKSLHAWEDPRYGIWRKTWKYFYTRSFFQVYVLQGVLMCIVALPIFLVNLKISLSPNYILTSVWWVIALLGLYYEIRADKELSNFIKIKKKWEILTDWLRKYSRYPQYFGESVFWLGICIIASQVHVFAFIWWWVITFLLVKVSGIPLLEKRYAWHTEYQKYSKKTPKFIPNYFL